MNLISERKIMENWSPFTDQFNKDKCSLKINLPHNTIVIMKMRPEGYTKCEWKSFKRKLEIEEGRFASKLKPVARLWRTGFLGTCSVAHSAAAARDWSIQEVNNLFELPPFLHFLIQRVKNSSYH